MGNRTTRSPHPSNNTTKADGHLLEYFRQNFGGGGGAALPVPLVGLVASGGMISDYTSGSDIYRAHIFNATGTFVVSSLSNDPTLGNTVDALVVAGGGGGGGQYHGGGGGAGGMRTSTSIPVSTSPGSYTVTIGAGGVGGDSATPDTSMQGVASVFSTVTSQGGGHGGGYNNPNTSPAYNGGNGGSGGGGNGAGGGATGGTGNKGDGTNQPYPTNVPAQGNNGGNGASYGGGGGGGAGANGTNGTGPAGGAGGNGSANTYAYGPTNPVTYAGGGGGGTYNAPGVTPAGGTGGGGTGAGGAADATATAAGNGGQGLGGGGGGNNGYNPEFTRAGNGGSGVVVVRYKIGSMSATKATGGSVSFHGGKTIHTFVGSGSLVVPATISDVEYVLVGGGGAGRSKDPGYAGGGGGAGGYINKTGQSLSAATYPVSIGAGGAINADGGNSTFNSETALGGGKLSLIHI